MRGRRAGEPVDREETKGILGCSPLLDVPGFDIINDMPLDEFHLLREGATKLMMERIFKLNSSDYAKEVFSRVNRAYTKMRVFGQSPRRTRTLLRLPDFKGNRFWQ